MSFKEKLKGLNMTQYLVVAYVVSGAVVTAATVMRKAV